MAEGPYSEHDSGGYSCYDLFHWGTDTYDLNKIQMIQGYCRFFSLQCSSE